MINSTYNNELQILETDFKGNITSQDILDYLIAFKDNTEYPRQLKSIVDATHTKLKFNYSELKSFNKAKNESLKNYDVVVSAIIIDSPIAGALSTLYGAIANSKKYKYKVFSTHEAALIWVNSFNFKT